MQRFTHDERRLRREAIANEAKQLQGNAKNKTEILSLLAQKYEVSVTTIVGALREHNVKLIDIDAREGRRDQRNERAKQIGELLRTTTMTYREIADKLDCTKQYVQIVHRQLLDDGVDVPLREEVRERLRKAKEQTLDAKDAMFVEHFKQTNDINESAQVADISILRATKILRKNRLNGTGIIVSRDVAEQHPSQRITRRWLYIIVDLLNPDLTATEIAEKWVKPLPFIFNLIAECRKAGLNIPKHKDGRTCARTGAEPETPMCKKCGNPFNRTFTRADGKKITCSKARISCFLCVPYSQRELDTEIAVTTKTSEDKDL